MKLPAAAALSCPVPVIALLHAEPITMVTVLIGQLATVLALAWVQLRRHRQGLASAADLVQLMGVAARVVVGETGRLEFTPLRGDAGGEGVVAQTRLASGDIVAEAPSADASDSEHIGGQASMTLRPITHLVAFPPTRTSGSVPEVGQ
jgi:hypothetical protein